MDYYEKLKAFLEADKTRFMMAYPVLEEPFVHKFDGPSIDYETDIVDCLKCDGGAYTLVTETTKVDITVTEEDTVEYYTLVDSDYEVKLLWATLYKLGKLKYRYEKIDGVYYEMPDRKLLPKIEGDTYEK